MGWIKNLGIGLIIFSMAFIGFFSLFQITDSQYDYASGFNYSDNVIASINNSTRYELETSFDTTQAQQEDFQNGTSLTSGTAYDNLIMAGYNTITRIWNYPVQIYSMATTTLSGVLGIDTQTYGWVYDGIFIILILLILFAILSIIFRGNI